MRGVVVAMVAHAMDVMHRVAVDGAITPNGVIVNELSTVQITPFHDERKSTATKMGYRVKQPSRTPQTEQERDE